MRALLLSALSAVLLAGCSAQPTREAQLDQLDARLAGNDADPALTGALRDQIMVDPALAQQANADALRPPPQPASGAVPPDDIAARPAPAEHDAVRPAPAATSPCPRCTAAREALTLGALAQKQGTAPAGCADRVAYSATWANKLPAGVPLYPDARVLEAAGADGKGCALRIVSFASAASVQHLLDWYFTRTAAAGYAAQHEAQGSEHLLGGTRPDGGAFLLTVRPRKGGGSEADLMADGG